METGTKRLPKEEFDKIYRCVPRTCAEIVVDTPQGIVMTKRLIHPYIGMWHIPGGTIYIGEKFEDAVNRVAADELGIDVYIKKMIGVIEYPKMYEDRPGHGIGIVFLCEPKSKEQKFRCSYQGEEINIFKTIPDNTVPEQKIFLDKLKIER